MTKKKLGYRLPDEVWARLAPLIPARKNTHPLGGGRPPRPDRDCADAIFFVLRMVLGMMMRKRVQTSSGYAEPIQYSDVPKDEPQQAARTYEAPAAASGARTGSVMDQFAGGAAQDDGVRDITAPSGTR